MKKLILLTFLLFLTIFYSQSQDYYFNDLYGKVIQTNRYGQNKPENVVLYGKCIKYTFGYNFNTMSFFNSELSQNSWDNCDECKQKIKERCNTTLTFGQKDLPYQINMEADYSDEILEFQAKFSNPKQTLIPVEYAAEIARCIKFKTGILYKNMQLANGRNKAFTNPSDCEFILNYKKN